MLHGRRNPDRTRERLLQAGFREIYRLGFTPASLEAIVERAGVTKGALYHHFPNKQELGYAVVEEVIGEAIEERWIRPLANTADPIEALIATIRAATIEDITLGCPLNNLAQEMSAVDDGFHRRIATLYRRWESAFAAALERGQKQGIVQKDVDARAAATFVVASIEGAFGLAKNRKHEEPVRACTEGLTRYLETLRVGTRRLKTARHNA